MAISVVCGGCGKTGAVPASLAGKRVKCSKCGTSMPIPSSDPIGIVATKTCTACGIDVSGQKRTKDQRGRYYCAPCWTARSAGQSAPAPQVAAPVGSTIGLRDEGAGANNWAGAIEPEIQALGAGDTVECPECRTLVAPSEMTTDEFGAAMCRPCYDVRNAPLDLAAASVGPMVAVTAAPPMRAPAVAAAYAPTRKTAVRQTSPSGGRSGIAQMAIGGVVCFLGTGATIAGYSAASSGRGGGRYTIFWGAIVFGAIGFFRGLARMMSGE